MLAGLYALGEATPQGLVDARSDDEPMRLAEQLDRAADELEAQLGNSESVAQRRASECEWLPQVVIAFAGTDSEALRCLVETAIPDRSGVAVVACGPNRDARWHLHVDGTGEGVLEGLAGGKPFRLPVDVQARPEMVERLGEALAASADPSDAAPVVELRPEPVEPGVVEIKVLGPVSVVNGGEPSEPYRQAGASAVLAYLATHSRPVSSEDLTAALWPVDDDFAAQDVGSRRKTLLNVVSRARGLLGKDEDGRQLLLYGNGCYLLAGAVSTDWRRFEGLIALASNQGPAEARGSYRRALEMVDGPPFGAAVSNEFFEWVCSEHLDLIIVAQVVDAADELAELSLAAQDFDTAIWAVEKGLSLDPAREQLYQHWMHALGRSGRTDHVSEIYRRLCSMLQKRIDPAQAPTPESEAIWRRYAVEEASRG